MDWPTLYTCCFPPFFQMFSPFIYKLSPSVINYGLNPLCFLKKCVIKFSALFLSNLFHFREVNHPNVLMLMGQCLETSPLLLIMEYAPNVSIKIHHSQRDILSFEDDHCFITILLRCFFGISWSILIISFIMYICMTKTWNKWKMSTFDIVCCKFILYMDQTMAEWVMSSSHWIELKMSVWLHYYWKFLIHRGKQTFYERKKGFAFLTNSEYT